MFYVGVDLHKSFVQVYGFNDATGEVVERRVSNDKSSIREGYALPPFFGQVQV